MLRDDWKLLIERRAAGAGPTAELKVGDIRRWIAEEQPGLPALVSDLLVACFAVQSDRAWFRAGQPVLPPPEIGRITPDMVLRRQELPGEEEFALAGDRAGSVFGLGSQPVRSARAVQALAAELRSRAGGLLPAAESLVTELDAATPQTLGLADDSPRLVTARTAAELLNRLTGLADSTALLRALAASALPREGAVYRASLNSAAEPDRQPGPGEVADSRSARRIRLTAAAQRPTPPRRSGASCAAPPATTSIRCRCAGALDQAEQAAIDLLDRATAAACRDARPRRRAAMPARRTPRRPGSRGRSRFTRRVTAREVACRRGGTVRNGRQESRGEFRHYLADRDGMTEQAIKAERSPRPARPSSRARLSKHSRARQPARRSTAMAAGDQRLLLLRAAPQWRGPATVTVDAWHGQVTADVRGCGTVLAVLDAITSPARPKRTWWC